MSDITPRIPPLPREEWTDDAREVFAFFGEPNSYEEGSKTNIMMVLANHPPLGIAFSIWGKHLLLANSLPLRSLEILILRVACRVRSIYEWHNHVGYAVNAGLTLDEIAAVRDYPGGEWQEIDEIVLKTVDELVDSNMLSDATWAVLGRHFDKRQQMDMVFSIGHYVMTSWALSAFGVEIEGGADAIGFDLATRSGQVPGKTYKPGETENWTESRGY